jgi:enoyl-CoA hydratase/carnithine racemase
MSHLRLTTAEHVATLWLGGDRLTLALLGELDKVLADFNSRPGFRALVIRSEIPGRFISGHDLDEVASFNMESDWLTLAERTQAVGTRLDDLSRQMHTVAFLDGPCLGPGLELALACSYRFALCRPTTRLALDQGVLGLPPWGGGTQRLPRLLGLRKAVPLLTGASPSGRQARDIGLVDHAVCERIATVELQAFLDRLRGRPPRRYRDRLRWRRRMPFLVRLPRGVGDLHSRILRAVWAGVRGGEAAGLAEERRALAELAGAPDCQQRLRQARHTAALDALPVEPDQPTVLSGAAEDTAERVTEALLHGRRVAWHLPEDAADRGRAAVQRRLTAARVQGLVTPLEADTLLRKMLVTLPDQPLPA